MRWVVLSHEEGGDGVVSAGDGAGDRGVGARECAAIGERAGVGSRGRAAGAATDAVPLPQLRPVRMGLILGVATASLYIAQERGWFTAEEH